MVANSKTGDIQTYIFEPDNVGDQYNADEKHNMMVDLFVIQISRVSEASVRKLCSQQHGCSLLQ